MILRDNLTILYIEDDPEDVHLLQELLQKSGTTNFFVMNVRRLSEGLETLKMGSIDVVVSDLNLPDSSGLETIKAIKKIDKDMPIIVLSGVRDIETYRAAIEMGVYEFITKWETSRSFLDVAINLAAARKQVFQKIENLKVVTSEVKKVVEEKAANG